MILIVLLAGKVREANAADVDAIFGVGEGVNHTHSTVMSLGLQLNKDWYLSWNSMGKADTYDSFSMWSAGRIVYFREDKFISPYVSIGAVWMDNNPEKLLGCDLMYQLGAGAEVWNSIQFGYTHISSADRCKPNKGVDFLTLSMRWRF